MRALVHAGMLVVLALQTVIAGNLLACMRGGADAVRMAMSTGSADRAQHDAGMAGMNAAPVNAAPVNAALVASLPAAPGRDAPSCPGGQSGDPSEGCDHTGVPSHCVALSGCAIDATALASASVTLAVASVVRPAPMITGEPGSFRAAPDSPPPRA